MLHVVLIFEGSQGRRSGGIAIFVRTVTTRNSDKYSQGTLGDPSRTTDDSGKPKVARKCVHARVLQVIHLYIKKEGDLDW